MLDLSWYYCCLAPAEKFVLAAYATLWALSSGYGLSPGEFALLWVGFSGSGAARQSAFMRIYFLQIVTMIDPVTELPTDRVVPSDEVYWTDVYLATLDGRMDCPQGCKQSRV